ncbi:MULTISPECIES: hypothetical protein [Citrobacter]|uniref:hypothetical protein n=1 Tax=Citrobacter TaxID=544 RepID=UPI0021824E58|nr:MULTISPECIES: hypothetical protein [Citrobacter]ELN2651919.1 hypothetical protein [Citrobacter braakii]MCS8551356.1 hypothetical protein [Citrobacter sp. XY323]MDM3357316.1 hypothetical protein [Citrobacter sp. Cb004]WFV19895.1 hypothetical protein NFJ22_09170 [Citrobacter braakii]WFW84267.1 hypothetical protein NFJ84_08535 [Citrobacter braakii]
MRFKSNDVYKSMLLLSFFFSGFSLYSVFIPLLILSLFLSGYKNKSLYLGSVATSFNILFIVLFVLCVFFIGFSKLYLDSPIKYAMYIIFMIVCLTLLLVNNIENAKGMLLFFILGIFMRAEFVVIYSFLEPSGVYGYGKLLDPFSHEEINSPGISNSLAIVFMYLVVAFKANTFNKRIFLTLLYPLLLLSSIFLGGRTFFIIAIISLLYQYNRNINLKATIWLCLISVGALITFSLIFKDLPVFDKYFNLVFERFGSEGLKSARFELIQDGITKFLMQPMGGFTPYASEYSGNWYHNIYLDSARVAGFIPLIMFLFSNFILLFSYLKYKKQNRKVKNPYFFLSILTLIVMCQDVVLEGNMMLLICYALFTTMHIQTGRHNKSGSIL